VVGSPTRLAGGVVTLYSGTVTTAGTVVGGTVTGLGGAQCLAVQAAFVYGSSGTSAKAYLQTSLDGASSWLDIASFAFATSSATRVFAIGMGSSSGTAQVTPADGALADNTQVAGILGDRFRVKVISTGTYAGNTTVTLSAAVKSA